MKNKKNKKQHCGGTVSKFFKKKRRKRQNDRAHSWLDTESSIKEWQDYASFMCPN